MQHVISYDLARGLHIISVVGWVSGMLMLPRFYAAIAALPPEERATSPLLRSARQIRTILLTPFMICAWAFGIFLFFGYFASDWDEPIQRLVTVPHWFWGKLVLALALTGYHGFLVSAGQQLAASKQRFSEGFWKVLGIFPFILAAAIILLATLEPTASVGYFG